MTEILIAVAFGAFVGNWALTPLVDKNVTHTDGFFIGGISAFLILAIAVIWKILIP